MNTDPIVREEMLKIRGYLQKLKSEYAEEAITEQFPDKERAKQYNLQMMDVMIDALDSDPDTTRKKVANIGKAVGEMAQDVSYTLDQAIGEINEIRHTMWLKNQSIMLEIGVSLKTALAFVELYNPLFDEFVHAFSLAYIKAYEASLDRAETEFLLLSAPVVPILDGVAVLPVIGTIDENRAELLMQTVLSEAASRQLDHIFIDLSGVTLIDTMIAHYIFKIVTALEVVGVSVVLIGIRPEIAQTVVSLGVDFTKIKTYHSLQQALKRQGIYEKASRIK